MFLLARKTRTLYRISGPFSSELFFLDLRAVQRNYRICIYIYIDMHTYVYIVYIYYFTVITPTRSLRAEQKLEGLTMGQSIFHFPKPFMLRYLIDSDKSLYVITFYFLLSLRKIIVIFTMRNNYQEKRLYVLFPF